MERWHAGKRVYLVGFFGPELDEGGVNIAGSTAVSATLPSAAEWEHRGGYASPRRPMFGDVLGTMFLKRIMEFINALSIGLGFRLAVSQ